MNVHMYIYMNVSDTRTALTAFINQVSEFMGTEEIDMLDNLILEDLKEDLVAFQQDDLVAAALKDGIYIYIIYVLYK
jgi:hypothetical protein